MTRRPPQTPEEEWEILDEIALEAEARDLASQTDAEVDASLRAHGVDPAEVDARGNAFVAELLGRAPPAPAAAPHPPLRLVSARPAPVEAQPAFAPEAARAGSPPRRYVRWAVVLLAATLASGVGVLVATRDAGPPPRRPEVPTPPPTAIARTEDQIEADDRRIAAAARCREGRYAECVSEYQAAALLDPAGDRDPKTRALHAAAEAAYEAQLVEAGLAPDRKAPLDTKGDKGAPKGKGSR